MVVWRYSFAFFTDFILRVYFNICDLHRISLSAAACLITWCMSQGVEEAWKKRSFMGAVQSLQHFLKFCLKFVGLAFAHCFILNPERKKKMSDMSWHYFYFNIALAQWELFNLWSWLYTSSHHVEYPFMALCLLILLYLFQICWCFTLIL